MKARTFLTLFMVAAGGFTLRAADERPGINYDEAKVGTLPIPDALTCEDGTKVTTKEQWLQKRRPELLKLFETEVCHDTKQRAGPLDPGRG